MYRYGRASRAENRTLHPMLQTVLARTLFKHDHSVDQGGRTEEQQQEFFDKGTSTLAPPKGKHLLRPDPSGQFDGLWSLAADVTPFINNRRLATRGSRFGYDQRAQFAYFLGILKAEADHVLEGTGWEIRLGVNWDMDEEILSDQDFDDWFHVELVWGRAT